MKFNRIPWLLAITTSIVVASGCGGSVGSEVQDEPQGGAGGDDEANVAGAPGEATRGAGGSGDVSAGGSAGVIGVGGSAGQGTGGSNAGGAANGGASGAGGIASPIEEPPAGYVRGAVGVGYGGIRILSRDGGKTWTKTGEVRQGGGDDGDLLRSVAYGNKLWVAGGWSKWWTSPDGATWTLRMHNFGIIQGLAYGNNMFIASTIDGVILRSSDGLAWTSLGNAGTGKHSRVVFGNGLFAVSGDPGQTVTSPDGTKWQKSPVPDVVAFCAGQFQTNRVCYGDKYNAGFWVQGLWVREIGGSIQTATDGKTWKSVYSPKTNGVDDLSIGWVPGE
ncbi:MAG: hypothetical protein SF187_06865 [Deltaproteobacteria bacterium]|nr:hypothetical protein [Deltaproteobacteria bacterium]